MGERRFGVVDHAARRMEWQEFIFVSKMGKSPFPDMFVASFVAKWATEAASLNIAKQEMIPFV